MAQSIAIKYLLKEWKRLSDEKILMLNRYNETLSELETSIECLSGKKVWEMEKEMVFDDESPDYIKSSQEEM